MNVIALNAQVRNSTELYDFANRSEQNTKQKQPLKLGKAPVTVGGAILGYRQYKSLTRFISRTSKFNHCLGRMREIEKIIRHRHREDNNIVPDTDDSSTYARLIACLFFAEYGADSVEKLLKDWMGRWYPWADQKYIDAVIGEIHPHFSPLSADYIGRHLHLTYAERCLLDIRTIRAFDVSQKECEKIQKEKHRVRDRELKKAKRRANGAVPREQSLSQTKPWEAEGISRSTWDRRRRKASNVQSLH